MSNGCPRTVASAAAWWVKVCGVAGSTRRRRPTGASRSSRITVPSGARIVTRPTGCDSPPDQATTARFGRARRDARDTRRSPQGAPWPSAGGWHPAPAGGWPRPGPIDATSGADEGPHRDGRRATAPVHRRNNDSHTARYWVERRWPTAQPVVQQCQAASLRCSMAPRDTLCQASLASVAHSAYSTPALGLFWIGDLDDASWVANLRPERTATSAMAAHSAAVRPRTRPGSPGQLMWE